MSSRILMIDDEPERLISHAEALEDEGYLVKRVSNIEEALHLLRNNAFDLLTLDLNMPPKKTEDISKGFDPRQTGVKLHREIREELGLTIPIIFISVVRDESIWNLIRENERKHGFDKIIYFKVPVRPSILAEAVNRFLEQRGEQV